MILSEVFQISVDVLVKDELLINGVKDVHSCGNNALHEKKEEVYEGVLIKESVSDENIIDFLNIHKIELWNTGGKPKYWTVLYFTCSKKDFPELISRVMISDPEMGGNWFVDFKSGNEKYIVFKDKILKYRIGNQADKDSVCSECRKMGILDEQMNWSE